MTRFGLARKTLTALAVSAALSPLAFAAGNYNSTVFFGDSLTDVGAFGGIAGLPQGARWTIDNADIYASLLAAKYGIKLGAANVSNNTLAGGGTGYAQGGARATEVANAGPGAVEIRDLPTQITDFLAANGGKADPNALYSIWIGGNDVPAALAAAAGAGGTAAGQAVISTAVTSTVNQVKELQKAGAKRIIVNNLPNFGTTPAATSSAIGAVVQQTLPAVGANLTAFASSAPVTTLLGGVPTTVANSVGGALGSGISSNVSAGLAAALTPSLGAAGAAAFQTAFNNNWSGALTTQLTGNLNTALNNTSNLDLATTLGTTLNTTVSNLNSATTIGTVTAQAAGAAQTVVAQGGATQSGLDAARASIVTAISGQLATLQTNVSGAMQGAISTGLGSTVPTAVSSAIGATVNTAVATTLGQMVAANQITAGQAAALSTAISAQLPTIVGQVAAGLPATLQNQIGPAVAAQLQATLATAFSAVSGSAATVNTQLTDQLSTTNANGAYLRVTSGANTFSGLFNSGLSSALAGQDVVLIDIQRLLSEIAADPAKYGFDNVTGQACGATSSLTCTSAQSLPGFLFADDRHPTPEAHKVVYQYIASVLDAPYFAAQLADVQSAAPQSAQAAVDERGVRARSVNGADVFLRMHRLHNDYQGDAETLQSGGANTAVTLGVDTQLGANAVVGAAVSQVRNHTEFAAEVGSFRATSRLLSLFGRYDMSNLSLGADVFFGSTRFDSIERHIQLGAATRTEQADTSGTTVGLRVQGSYTLALGNVSLIPTANLSFSESTVGGYAEANQCGSAAKPAACSTTMRFDEQRVDSLLAGLGAKAEINLGKLTPFASVMAYKETKDDARNVGAGLVSQTTTFKTEVAAPDSSYATLGVGARAQVTKALNGYVSYSHTYGLDNEKRNSVAFGLQGSF